MDDNLRLMLKIALVAGTAYLGARYLSNAEADFSSVQISPNPVRANYSLPCGYAKVPYQWLSTKVQ